MRRKQEEYGAKADPHATVLLVGARCARLHWPLPRACHFAPACESVFRLGERLVVVGKLYPPLDQCASGQHRVAAALLEILSKQRASCRQRNVRDEVVRDANVDPRLHLLWNLGLSAPIFPSVEHTPSLCRHALVWPFTIHVEEPMQENGREHKLAKHIRTAEVRQQLQSLEFLTPWMCSRPRVVPRRKWDALQGNVFTPPCDSYALHEAVHFL
mmetsp:Transcript_29872/g.81999  ORF Transcript_29872/g.81999 Transcript_29872/m.81999 type:complete len:214 (+) Transcript_29872:348-989(+)